MKIGIISDTHDNISNLKKVLNSLNRKNIDMIIHCGDFCSPLIIKQLKEIGTLVHCVFGNTDDRFTTTRLCDNSKNITLHGDIAEIEIEGKNIAVTHFHKFAEGLASTGKYDIVFYGHTHIKDMKEIGKTKLINPGEIMGVKGKPTYAVYDTKDDSVEFFEV